MPIVQLSLEQIAELREAVTATFLQRSGRISFVYGTDKKKYEAIRADIYEYTGVPETQISIGRERLRKFFYYTNPAVCRVELLEQPSFGREFIDVLQAYSGVNVLEPSAHIQEEAAEREVQIAVSAKRAVAKPAKKEIVQPNPLPLLNTDYMKAMLYGGALVGFITALLTVSITFFNGYNGYPNNELMPLIFLMQVILGSITGWFCGFIILKGEKITVLQQIMLFVISFVCFALIRQLATRNALVGVGKARGGGGGPLGEPDFEMVATAGAYAAGILLLANFLIKNKMPDFTKSIVMTIQTALIGGVVFAGVYVGFLILIKNDIIPVNESPFGSFAIFRYSFPNPQRIFLVVILGAIYTFSILNLLRWQLNRPQ